MREHGSDVEAARALDVHEKRVRGLYEALELVLPFFLARGRVEEVAHHGVWWRSAPGDLCGVSRVCFLFGGRRSLSRLEPRAAALCEAFWSLRRPALAVGRGFVARGRPPRRFFELLKSCLQKLVLAVSTTARHALAQAVRPAVARRDASVVSALVSTSSAIYGLNWSSSPRQAANSSAVLDSRKRRSPSLPTSSWTASRRESFRNDSSELARKRH